MHWGISSRGVDADLSWGMMAGWNPADFNSNRVSPALYYSFAVRFNPDRYDPDKWLAAAADGPAQADRHSRTGPPALRATS